MYLNNKARLKEVFQKQNLRKKKCRIFGFFRYCFATNLILRGTESIMVTFFEYLNKQFKQFNTLVNCDAFTYLLHRFLLIWKKRKWMKLMHEKN